MQLTYGQFKKVASKSNNKLFDKFSEIIAESENAALMAMYDDKLILLDEDTHKPYACTYSYSNGVLEISDFEPIDLAENGGDLLHDKVDQLFDIESDPAVSTSELIEGFRAKYHDHVKAEITEAIENKLKKIYGNPSIQSLFQLREARDLQYNAISELLSRKSMKKLQAGLRLEGDSIEQTLNRLDWENKKGYKVDTNIYTYIEPDIKDLEDKSAKKRMKALAGKLYKLWKSDVFREKFSNFQFDLKQTEDMEEALDRAELFFEDNKELFLLESSRMDEVILKTALMVAPADANELVEIFKQLVRHPNIKAIKESYFDGLGASPEEIAQIMFEQDELSPPPAAPGVEAPPAEPEEGEEEAPKPKKSKAADDAKEQDIKDAIAIFKKIKSSVDDPDAEQYVDNLTKSLEYIQSDGIESSKINFIMDFLHGALEKPEESEKEKEEPGKEGEKDEKEAADELE